jgi:hypothetical protein
MSDTIFILIGRSGEHWERSRWTVCASHDREKLEKRSKKLLAKYRLNMHYYRLREDFCGKWHDENPMPPTEGYVDIPRWESGLRQEQITKEMRDERNRLIEENNQRLARNKVIDDAHDALYDAAVRAFFRDLLKSKATDPDELDDKSVDRILELSWREEPEYTVETLEII